MITFLLGFAIGHAIRHARVDHRAAEAERQSYAKYHQEEVVKK